MDFNPRYARHYSLKGFGPESQQKLLQARVLVVGAGGLGCPVLQYLTAAGIGTLGIADGDVVSISNLQRQVLYDTDSIGSKKARTAAMKLRRLNPEIAILVHDTITVDNALELFESYDVIVDCTDNFASRYLINDACVLLKKPLVFGAIYQFEGQVAVFNVADSSGVITNYRDLFPIPPDPSEVLNCNEAGVLGVLPASIGSFQAAEAIKLIAGLNGVLLNKLMTFNLMDYTSFVVEVSPNSKATSGMPTNKELFKKMDYDYFCGNNPQNIIELQASDFIKKSNSNKTVIIDVREIGELPEALFPHLKFPFSQWGNAIPVLDSNDIVLFCQSGKRSLQAAMRIMENSKGKKVSHLKGGMSALQEYQEKIK